MRFGWYTRLLTSFDVILAQELHRWHIDVAIIEPACIATSFWTTYDASLYAPSSWWMTNSSYCTAGQKIWSSQSRCLLELMCWRVTVNR